MAKSGIVKFYKILNSQLSSLSIVEGQLIFVRDTGKMFIDIDNTNRVPVDGVDYTGANGVTITNKTITNSGVRAIEEGTANGTISVNTNGTVANISVHGLGDLAYLSSLNASDVGAIDASLKGANNGVAELDSTGKVPSSQLPSYVDDVLEYNNRASFPATGETGKIYVAKDTNLTYRWSGSDYVEISKSLALGETSSTAYRGDLGAAAYAHGVTNKGSAFASGLYKITTNSEGHVTAATAVVKNDITALGIPASNTTYSAGTGLTLDGTTFKANIDSSLNSTSTNPVQNKVINSALGNKLSANDITITPVQESGATVGTIKVGNTITTLYAPAPGNVSTELANPKTTYYLTGVTDTHASSGSQMVNTRVSNQHTGVSYTTSTSEAGGTLAVDGREVTLGLYYSIS